MKRLGPGWYALEALGSTWIIEHFQSGWGDLVWGWYRHDDDREHSEDYWPTKAQAVRALTLYIASKQRANPDEDLRALERAASLGDERAAMQLARALERQGGRVPPPPSPMVLKKTRDFEQTGEYTVSYRGKRARIFRDPTSAISKATGRGEWFMHPRAQDSMSVWTPGFPFILLGGTLPEAKLKLAQILTGGRR